MHKRKKKSSTRVLSNDRAATEAAVRRKPRALHHQLKQHRFVILSTSEVWFLKQTSGLYPRRVWRSDGSRSRAVAAGVFVSRLRQE